MYVTGAVMCNQSKKEAKLGCGDITVTDSFKKLGAERKIVNL
jgi:hypothetical protein